MKPIMHQSPRGSVDGVLGDGERVAEIPAVLVKAGAGGGRREVDDRAGSLLVLAGDAVWVEASLSL